MLGHRSCQCAQLGILAWSFGRFRSGLVVVIACLDTSYSQSRDFPPFPVGLAHQRIRCFGILKA